MEALSGLGRLRGSLVAAGFLLRRPSLAFLSSTRAASVRMKILGSDVDCMVETSGGTYVMVVPKLKCFSSSERDVSCNKLQLPKDHLMPQYVPRAGESEKVKRARLLYQSRKRGMLENGLLLSTFASHYLDQLTLSQLDQYDELINHPSNDWQLYYWITGHEEVPDRYDNEVMQLLQKHSRNEEREWRFCQPDLTPPKHTTDKSS